jgi:hypothetical protein
MFRNQYNLFIYFHCWADQGLVPFFDKQYVEGQLIPGYYHAIQDLVKYLHPAAFAIESFSPDLLQRCNEFPSVFLSNRQASRKKILSQLYSISRADAIRESFEVSENIKSDVVVRMRFDAVPHNFTLNEIDYIAAHPDAKVLFAPSPAWHNHPGGGGGCKDCHSFFDANWRQSNFETRAHEFLKYHRRHGNDICDLFAVSSPRTMKRYAKIYSEAHHLNTQIQDDIDPRIMQDYHLVQDGDEASDHRIQTTSAYPFDIEESPVFVPEKLIRFQMAGFLIVHGETIVVIQRR